MLIIGDVRIEKIKNTSSILVSLNFLEFQCGQRNFMPEQLNSAIIFASCSPAFQIIDTLANGVPSNHGHGPHYNTFSASFDSSPYGALVMVTMPGHFQD